MIIVSFFFHFPVEAAFIFFCYCTSCNHRSDSVLRLSKHDFCVLWHMCVHLLSLHIFILFYSLTHISSCHHSYYPPGPLGTGKINSLTKIWQQLLKALFFFWPLRFEMLHSGHPQSTCTPPIHTLALLSPDQLPYDPASLSVSFSALTKRTRYDGIQSNDTTKFKDIE